MTPATLLLLALLQSAGSTSSPPVPPVAPQAVPADPSRLLFPAGTSGLVLVLVKPDRTADYEAVIGALAQAIAAASPEQRRVGEGWTVYKAQEADAKGNVVYVHWLSAPAADVDYRPSVVLDQLAATIAEPLLVKYRDALAAAPTRLSLTQVADLGLAPVVRAKPQR